MRVFVSEFVCSGAWGEPDLPPSLAREGRAMLLALLADLAVLPDVTLCTTWDARLGEFPPGNGIADGLPLDIECAVVRAARDESAAFRRFAAECDATYVIAPELDDLLTQRVCTVLDCGGRSLNAAPEAIATCSDKWETFQRLSYAGIATVQTVRFDPTSPPFDFPLVIKPRFGAGSQDMFLVRNRAELEAAAARFPSNKPTNEAIVQPFVAGRALSVSAIYRTDGTLREVWPVAEQKLSEDGRFSYLGGRVGGIFDFRFPIVDLMTRISESIPGLSGYVGFDLILPEESDAAPVIVDINPRLTTSYLGYRVLSRVNQAGRVLWPDASRPSLDWRSGCVEFGADGAAAVRASLRGAAKHTPES